MIFNLMNGRMKTPILNSAFPADVTILNGESATFQVVISEDGMPDAYTYQWYVDGDTVSGETGKSYTYTSPVGSANYTKRISCTVTNAAGTVQSREATVTVNSHIPVFTYTGNYKIVNDSDGASSPTDVNWKIRLLTSGTLTFTDLRGAKNGIDVFLVGGGGNGGSPTDCSDGASLGGAGGAGGYTTTKTGVPVTAGTNYAIAVGGSGGGNTSAFGYSANGGGNASTWHPGSGGTGGGASGGGDGANGGTNGGNGSYNTDSWNGKGGSGDGKNKYEFGNSSLKLYCGGGGGGGLYNWNNGKVFADGKGGSGGGANGTKSASANTGGGGGGARANVNYTAGSGGSGIVVIRNKR